MPCKLRGAGAESKLDEALVDFCSGTKNIYVRRKSLTAAKWDGR